MIDLPCHRIEKSRKDAGFRSAMQAASTLRMPYTTYVGYEKGTREIDMVIAERLAKGFRVDAVWLLTGKGSPRTALTGIPVMGRVGAGAAVEPVQDAAYADAIDRIELPDTEHCAIVIVQGESQLPRYRDGEAIIYDTRARLPDDMAGQEAVVDMLDGRRLIKIVRRSGSHFWLESHNADPEMDARILACYPVVGRLSGYASPFVRPGSRRLKR